MGHEPLRKTMQGGGLRASSCAHARVRRVRKEAHAARGARAPVQTRAGREGVVGQPQGVFSAVGWHAHAGVWVLLRGGEAGRACAGGWQHSGGSGCGTCWRLPCSPPPPRSPLALVTPQHHSSSLDPASTLELSSSPESSSAAAAGSPNASPTTRTYNSGWRRGVRRRRAASEARTRASTPGSRC